MIEIASRSLRAKVMLVVLATTVSALLFAAFALAIYEIDRYQDAIVADVRTQAEILGRVSEPALTFDDRRAAGENLASLRLRPQMQAAALYDAKGALFATYGQGGSDVPPAVPADGYRIEGARLDYVHPLVVNGQRLGTVYLSRRYDVGERITDWATILVAVMLASFMVALAMSAWLQGVVTRPIREVTDVAKRVVDERDFSLRVESDTRDEIGVLVRAFNDMLGEVGRHARALEEATETLQHEIAERRAAEQALRIADRRKDEFLATLAHELRNPLAPLRNGLDMLRLPQLSPERLTQVRELMARQLAQMVRLVDDLLDVSRISTGKLAVRLAPVDLAGIVASAVDTTRPLIEAHGHRLSVDVPREPVVVDADATRLAQVVANLLNNAAKYTPAGGSIALRVAVHGDDVEISVADSGIGIPPDMLDRVFEMFTQVDTSLDRSTAGLGVGLSLARRLTELHGGTIEAASAGSGKGSAFTVRLPRVLHEATAAPVATPAPASTAKHRILLADDNVDFATSLAFILRSMGHEVAIAHDGAEALEAARRLRPDFAFLDIGLPKLHGYALARALRDEPSTRDTVLVAITGWGQERDRRQARDAGFDHHFVKPVGVDELLEVLAARVTPGG